MTSFDETAVRVDAIQQSIIEYTGRIKVAIVSSENKSKFIVSFAAKTGGPMSLG